MLTARRVAVAALLVTLGACRADSILTPAAPGDGGCAAVPCGTPGTEPAPAPNASIVIVPLEDAVERIAPWMMDDRARTELPPVLNALRAELLAGRLGSARLQLARSYDAVDMAERRLGGTALVLDLADLSAIRLALVPASAALGVAVR